MSSPAGGTLGPIYVRSNPANPSGPLGQLVFPATINVADSTRYVKSGQPSTLDALALNDAVVVKGKLSRCDLRDADPAAMPALTAKMVVVQLPEAVESS